MNKSDKRPMPPDLPGSPVNEPTALLPLIEPPRPRITGRAVIVYEPEPRPRRALWVFTALMVALTTGVVLGQTSAYQEPRRSLSAAEAATVPAYETPPVVAPSTGPVPGPQITVPLGAAKTRVLEVTGASTALRIRSAELGPMLFSVDSADGSAMPGFVDTPTGPRLSLIRTGVDATDIQLNAKVRWTIRLTGEATTQEIDMRAGGLAGIEMAGAASDAMLGLPRPAKSVALRVTGTIGNLRIVAGPKTPVRLRLTKGAQTTTLDGTAGSNAKSGKVLTSAGWTSAEKRYDIKVSAKLNSVTVDHTP